MKNLLLAFCLILVGQAAEAKKLKIALMAPEGTTWGDGMRDMAKEIKGTLMAPYEDIQSVVATTPKFWDTLTRGGSVLAILQVREKKLKKMTWEIRDQQSLQTVCEFLPAKLGDRVQVNL